MPRWQVRPYVDADLPEVLRIAGEGDADIDAMYLQYVAQAGRLLVGFDPNTFRTVAFGGAIPVRSVDRTVLMVTDLFVEETNRGYRAGTELLAALVGDHQHRMTSSSKEQAALQVYHRQRMDSKWKVRYMEGWGSKTDTVPSMLAASRLEAWRHDRPDLIDYYFRRGAIVGGDSVMLTNPVEVRITRLHTDDAIDVLRRLIAHFPSRMKVSLCVPEHHPLSTWLDDHGFTEVDHDWFCCTQGVRIDPDLAVIDPGLW
jgi:hypothetical protein